MTEKFESLEGVGKMKKNVMCCGYDACIYINHKTGACNNTDVEIIPRGDCLFFTRKSDEDITDQLHPFIVRCRRIRCMFYRPADSDQFTGSCSKPSIVITDAGCMSYNPDSLFHCDSY